MKARVQSERDCVEAFACALDANVPCVVLRQESSALIMCCVDCEEIVAVECRTPRLDFAAQSRTAQADACDKTCLSSSAHRARPWRPLRAPLALPRVVRLVRTSSQHCIIRSCRRSTPTSCYRPFFRTSFSYRQQHPIRINHCAPRSAFAPGSSSSHRNLQSYPGAKAAASNREMICRPSLPPLLHPHARRSCSSFASRSSPRRS